MSIHKQGLALTWASSDEHGRADVDADTEINLFGGIIERTLGELHSSKQEAMVERLRLKRFCAWSKVPAEVALERSVAILHDLTREQQVESLTASLARVQIELEQARSQSRELEQRATSAENALQRERAGRVRSSKAFEYTFSCFAL